MCANHRIVFLSLLQLLLQWSLSAQEREEWKAGLQGSYASSVLQPRADKSVITDQNRTYLQAYLFKSGAATQEWGLHLTFLESSIDQQAIPGFPSTFILERNRAFGLGCIHRLYKTLWKEDILLFFQSSLDAELARRRRIMDLQNSVEPGLGLRFQIRPGIKLTLTKELSLEFGFGLLNLNTMQYFNPTISRLNKVAMESNLDVSFGPASVFFGITFKI